MKDKLISFIKENEFREARKMYLNEPFNQLEKDIIEIAYDTEDVGVYFFVLDCIEYEESAKLHSIAFDLLCNVFNFISGAYFLAYNHMKKAVELDYNNYEYKEGLLLFYHLPEKILSKEEAINIALEILKEKPDNQAANSIINEY